MRALVVVNPKATTTSPRTRDVIIAALGNDLDVEVAETGHRGHATELGRDARRLGLDLVVAVGGDGTINEVVNGILDPNAAGPTPDAPALGIVPGGSTNVFARNIGIPEDPVEATGLLLDAVRSGRRQSVALGRLDGRWFTFAAGAGLDADVVRTVEAERARGRQATTGLYVRTAVRRFFAQDDRAVGSIVVRGDDDVPTPGLNVVLVTNTTPWTYVGPIPVRPTPRTDLRAGLDAFGLTGLRLLPTLAAVWHMMGRKGPRGRGVASWHDQKRLRLTSSVPVPVQVDGDDVGDRTDVEVVAVADALRIAY